MACRRYNPRRRSSGGGIDAISALINVALIGLGGYALYEVLMGTPAQSVRDPFTGQSGGPINALDQWLFPMTFPGGGEVTGSAETYTGALTESVLHPITTMETIFGLNQDAAPAPAVPPPPYGGGGGGAF